MEKIGPKIFYSSMLNIAIILYKNMLLAEQTQIQFFYGSMILFHKSTKFPRWNSIWTLLSNIIFFQRMKTILSDTYRVRRIDHRNLQKFSYMWPHPCPNSSRNYPQLDPVRSLRCVWTGPEDFLKIIIYWIIAIMIYYKRQK